MINKFIAPSSAVILCVMPATVDLPTCECVMLSKQVDLDCERTIGVITKVDIAERGIRRKLDTAVDQLGLALGVVAIRNRSQEEIDRHVSWESSREMEKLYFRSHPELSSLYQDDAAARNNGEPNLLMLGLRADQYPDDR